MPIIGVVFAIPNLIQICILVLNVSKRNIPIKNHPCNKSHTYYSDDLVIHVRCFFDSGRQTRKIARDGEGPRFNKELATQS